MEKWHEQRAAHLLALIVLGISLYCLNSGAAVKAQAETRTFWNAEKDGIAIKLFRGNNYATVCIWARPPSQISGEYGIHAKWGNSGKEALGLYSSDEHISSPLRFDFLLPSGDQTLKLDIGSCIPESFCNSVEFDYDMRKLSTTTKTTCGRSING